MFSWELFEISKNTIFDRRPLVAASVSSVICKSFPDIIYQVYLKTKNRKGIDVTYKTSYRRNLETPVNYLLNNSLLAVESFVRKCSVKKVFLKMLCNLQENECSSLFFKQVSASTYNFIKKKRPLIQAFSCEFFEIFKKTFFREDLRTNASKTLK